MKIQSILVSILIFFLISTLSKAQITNGTTATISSFISSLPTDDYNCGGHTLIGKIYTEYERINGDNIFIYAKDTTFAEDNKFYLEISAYNSSEVAIIQAQSSDKGRPGKAIFILPDSLKIGGFYLIKMGSTNPALKVEYYTALSFGSGAIPYLADFSQELIVYPNSPQANLKLTIKPQDYESLMGGFSLQNIRIKLTDGTIYENSISIPLATINLPILPKDTLTYYKISEIINDCGVKAQISGEAKVIKRDFIQQILISPTANSSDLCSSTPFSINISSKSITSKTTLKVEFSNDNFSSLLSTENVVLDKDNNIKLEMPNGVTDYGGLYVRILSESPQITSNAISFNVFPKTDTVNPYITTFNENDIFIYFDQKKSIDDNSVPTKLQELVVNGVDYANSEAYKSGLLKIAIPKKDTLLTFSKISNACGALSIIKSEIRINPSELQFFTFKSDDESVCQGKTITYNYTYSNKSNANRTNFFYFLEAIGNEFDISTQSYTGIQRKVYINRLENIVDTLKKTVTIKIPADLDEQLNNKFGNKRIDIETITLNSYYPNNFDSFNTNMLFLSPRVLLKSKIALTQPNITTNGIGYTNIPVVFSGSNGINYKLSNGKSGVLSRTTSDCRDCITHQYLNEEGNINVFIEKNTTFSVSSAQSRCDNSIVTGSTNVFLNELNEKKLIIDESQLSNIACGGRKVEIPIRKYGNWDSTEKIKAFVKTTYYNGGNFTNEYPVDSSSFSYKVPTETYNQKIDIWVEATASNTKSNIHTFELKNLPNTIGYNTSYQIQKFDKNIEINYVPDNSSLSFYGNGGNLEFKINGKKYIGEIENLWHSYFSRFLVFEKDTLINFQSVSNYCGSVEVNKQIRISKLDRVIYNNGEINDKYFQPNSECSGSKHIIKYSYFGTQPTSESIIVQLAKFNSNLSSYQLKFFDVPTTKITSNELSFMIPDSAYGDYVYRIRNLKGNDVSNMVQLNYTIKQKPIIKLSTQSGKPEVVGTPGATLFINGNFDKAPNTIISLNDGRNLSYNNFGIYLYSKFDTITLSEKTEIYNYGKYFNPTQTTTYSVKSAYNTCGNGIIEGNPTIIINPTVLTKLRNSELSTTFCTGDSLTLDLDYIGGFSKDTLMGVYLHTNAKSSYNQELTTFKNNPSSLKIKLPNDIYSGYYFIQIRKKSRSKNYFAGNINPDSLSKVNARLNWDCDPIYFRIATVPNINLSGSTEIFAGSSVQLHINPVNNNGQDIAITKDTINFIGGMAYYYEFMDGSKYISNGGLPILTPSKTTTYTITSVKNACGAGKATGNATVTVLPKNEKRIESIGFPRHYFSENIPDIIYESSNQFCAGKKDSLDIKVYGVGNNTDFSKYKVGLSDKDGFNFFPVKTTKAKTIIDSTNYKIVRLWHELPDNLMSGYNYKIKGMADDESIVSKSLPKTIKIIELPTAEMTGNVAISTGEKVNALVKFTGDAPWSISLIDADKTFIYNGLPTKTDSTEKFKNYQPKLIYTKELKLELSPEKSNTYKIAKVANQVCGLGIVNEGVLIVELILANESSSTKNLIQLYPNPTVNQLTIDLTSLKDTTKIHVFDINGRLIQSKIFDLSQIQEKQSLDFSQYNTGVYFIKISSEKFSQTYRVVRL